MSDHDAFKVRPKGRPFNVYTVNDVCGVPPRDYLLKGLISPGELSMIYGEPGCGKTFFALYVAWMMAQGREVFGRRVKSADVLYLSLEGEGAFFNRVQAFAQEYGGTDGLRIITEPVGLFDDGDAIDMVIDAVRTTRAKFLILDTLARLMGSGDENHPGDVGKIIAALDQIRQATGAHVLLVHHAGKDERRGMRGHSSLNGAADVVLKVTKDGQTGQRSVEVEKNRNGPSGVMLGFTLRAHSLGKDDDGDSIETCVLDEIEAAIRPRKRAKLSDFQAMVFKSALNLIASDGAETGVVPRPGMPSVTAVRRDLLRRELQAKGVLESHAGQPMTQKDKGKLRDALTALENKGQLCATGEWVWLP